MREIPLTHGKIAFVDDEDYDKLSSYTWHTMNHGRTSYARSTINGKKIFMHAVIVKPESGKEIDHINGNGLDNRKENLRLVTHRVNSQNLHIKKLSKYPGVTFHKQRGKWMARIKINGKNKALGLYLVEEEAFEAYKKAVNEL